MIDLTIADGFLRSSLSWVHLCCSVRNEILQSPNPRVVTGIPDMKQQNWKIPVREFASERECVHASTTIRLTLRDLQR